jgi:hypothetical protein
MLDTYVERETCLHDTHDAYDADLLVHHLNNLIPHDMARKETFLQHMERVWESGKLACVTSLESAIECESYVEKTHKTKKTRTECSRAPGGGTCP